MEVKRRRTKRGDTGEHLKRAMARVKSIPEAALTGDAFRFVELAALLRNASHRGLDTVPLREDGTVNEVILKRELQRAKAGRRPWEPKRGRAAEPSFLPPPPSPNARGSQFAKGPGFQLAEGPELRAHPGALLRDLMALSRRVEKLKDRGVEPAVCVEGFRTVTALVTPEDARWFLEKNRGGSTHDWHAFARLEERYPTIAALWAGPAELSRVYRRDRAKLAAEDRRARAELAELERRGHAG